MNSTAIGLLTLAASGIVVVAAQTTRPGPPTPAWDPAAAATYLDQRQSWWESWSRSARDHGTVCLSCHTAVPYALARPGLRAALHENGVPSPERKLIDDVVTRVREWSQIGPYYGSSAPEGLAKATESRGTEAVLNALVLASRDQLSGTVSTEAKQAFANMFALQLTSGDAAGSWSWLDFGLRPWESPSAAYFGAALAAIAIGREPHGYAQSAEIRPNIERLRTYLQTHLDLSMWNRVRGQDDPAVLNRAMLLWASGQLPGLISADERKALTTTILQSQRSDGGWSLRSIGRWSARDSVSTEETSDGYATGLIAYALEQSGSAPDDPHLVRALAWLAEHQDPKTGMWVASSLNKRRDPATYIGKFMSDAATAYAVLALTGAQR